MTGTDVKLRARDVVEATQGSLLSGDMGVVFSSVGTDSRKVIPGELFVALKGPRFDGHDFVAAAIESGASGALVERWPEGLNLFHLHKAVTVIKVQDTLKALGDLAGWWRRKLGLKVLAITGSCGKTTTKDLAAAIYSQVWPTIKTEGNLNNLIGLPLCLLKARQELWAVLEMGANRIGEIARLCEIAAPDVGLVTNVFPAHLEGFGDLKGVYRAKGELYEALVGKTAVVCRDDEVLYGKAAAYAARMVTYSLSGAADVTADSIEETEEGLGFFLRIEGQSLPVKLRLYGRHNVLNALAAAACGLAAGISLETIIKGLENIEGRAGRFYPQRLATGAILIDDTYNANPASVAAGLKAARRLANGRPLIVVLADMLELGERASFFHQSLAEEVFRQGADLLFTYGELSRQTNQRAQELGLVARHLETKDELVSSVREALKDRPQAVILAKGSRAMGLDEFCKRLKEGD
ncbi:UDP-N-acetylmuramoyl-tripeptide--D-alanyl-D-alanine ligase [Thermosulfuriphilus sp.]